MTFSIHSSEVLDIRRFSTGLELQADGIWTAESQSAISYPDEGHSECLQVEEQSFWFRHRNAVISTVIRRCPPPSNLIFDVGGGNGFVARALSDAGNQVVLVEPGRHGALNARRLRRLQNVVQAGFDDARFIPSSLPAIGLFDVIEHVDQDRDLLVNMRETLIPNGFLYVTVPAHQGLWSIDDQEAGHFRRYTTRSLQKLLSGAGFSIVFASYFFSFLPLPIYLFRVLPSKLKLRSKRSSVIDKNEHVANSLSSSVIDFFLRRELGRIAQGRPISFGSSIVIAARKE